VFVRVLFVRCSLLKQRAADVGGAATELRYHPARHPAVGMDRRVHHVGFEVVEQRTERRGVRGVESVCCIGRAKELALDVVLRREHLEPGAFLAVTDGRAGRMRRVCAGGLGASPGASVLRGAHRSRWRVARVSGTHTSNRQCRNSD
jgi:hypothetical protein